MQYSSEGYIFRSITTVAPHLVGKICRLHRVFVLLLFHCISFNYDPVYSFLSLPPIQSFRLPTITTTTTTTHHSHYHYHTSACAKIQPSTRPPSCSFVPFQRACPFLFNAHTNANGDGDGDAPSEPLGSQTSKQTRSTSQPKNDHNVCTHCNSTFPSRNALFRHIQSPTDTCLSLQLAQAAKSNNTSYLEEHNLYWKGRLHSTVMYRNNNKDCNSQRPSISIVPIVEETLVLLVGYDNHRIPVTPRPSSNNTISACHRRDRDLVESESDTAARLLREAFDTVLRRQDKQYQLLSNTTSIETVIEEGDTPTRISAMTQSTAARMRHASLSQEMNCAALGDVIVLTYQKYLFPAETSNLRKAYANTNTNNTSINFNASVDSRKITTNNNTASSIHNRDRDSAHYYLSLTNLLQTVNEELQTQRNYTNDSKYLHPRILCAVQNQISEERSPSSSSSRLNQRFHAERSCTQRIYHYLLPLSWLPAGELAEEWCRGIVTFCDEKDTASTTKARTTQKSIQKTHQRSHAIASPSNLKELKQLLKSAESQRFSSPISTSKSTSASSDAKSNMNTKAKPASGRFGKLANRERRCWHNFADLELRGDASPSNEPVWRSLDRARSGQFLMYNHPDIDLTNNDKNHNYTMDTSAIAILEFCGDGFVKQQIRRIVGSVIAMAHGWLPSNFIEVATRADTVVETPLAPPNRMYFAEARFHFEELGQHGRVLENGGALFQDAIFLKEDCDDWTEDIQNALLSRCSEDEIKKREVDWLVELRDVVTPRIRAQLAQLQEDDENRSRFKIEDQSSKKKKTITANLSYTPPPYKYDRVLKLLREIVATEQWPATSTARSKVIRSESVSDDEVIQSGSFTVVNPTHSFDISSVDTRKDLPKITFPKANKLFPELVEAAFELEDILSSHNENNKRPSSTHCAINCNADFTPHVDSGRGKGQSLSMIVGLGDYLGGELSVENSLHPIRYEPLEFDGWKQRHWTLPFRGERFSLVWFSPE